jgi:hypothetical protein
MNIFRATPFVLAASLGAAATAPDTVVGAIYTESSSQLTASPAPRSSTLVTARFTNTYILNPDGSFSHLFTKTTAGGVFVTNVQLRPPGSWEYRKMASNAAILRLDGSDRTLQFTEAAAGTWTNAVAANFATEFSFQPFAERSKIANTSSRSFVRAGGRTSAGFVVTGDGAIVLLRAVGPGLARFGVESALRQPQLRVIRASSGAVVAASGGWSSGDPEAVLRIIQMGTAVGAFPLSDGRDAAIVLSPDPGAYVAEAFSSDGNESGEVLVEAYVIP